MRGLVGRDAELAAIDAFLALLSDGPGLLRDRGRAGHRQDHRLARSSGRRHRPRGHRVLTCSGTSADARLSYAALADLLAEIDLGEHPSLPAVQRDALDAALLRGGDLVAADHHAVSAAALSVLGGLAERGPVLVAVDDLQWVDVASRRVLEYCARRLPSGAGLLASRRTDGAASPAAALAGLLAPDRVETVTVAGLPAEAMHRLVREHASGRLERRLANRIVEVAGGNPLYAVELLRGLPAGAEATLRLPPSLSEMVRVRLHGLGRQPRSVLLAVAAMATPTLLLLSEALGSDAVEALSEPERRGIVTVHQDRVSFSHPLIAEGVYAGASTAERREVHRRLSAVATDPEERARHLAAAGTVPEAVVALQEAAATVRDRGAPDAAAELLELAVGLGGDRALVVRAAEHRFDAGDTRGAVRMLEDAIASLPAGLPRAEALLLLGEIRYKDDSFPAAHLLLEQARAEAGDDERLVLMGELRSAYTLYNLGRLEEAGGLGATALARAERLGEDALLAQALAVSVIVDFALGRGLDEQRLARALRLQDPGQRTGAELYPGLIATFLYLWSSRFEEGRAAMDAVRDTYLERGEEPALAWSSFTRVWLEVTAGDVRSTAAAAAEAHDRLLLLDTVTGRALAHSARGARRGLRGQVRRGEAGLRGVAGPLRTERVDHLVVVLPEDAR